MKHDELWISRFSASEVQHVSKENERPSALRPGIYPIGSAESRAAARMLAQQRDDQTDRLEVILSGAVCRVSGDPKQPSATAWMKCANGRLMRGLIVPDGMTVEEAQQRVRF
jgi:hypothetical protein